MNTMEFKATFDLSPIISGGVDGASAIEMLRLKFDPRLGPNDLKDWYS